MCEDVEPLDAETQLLGCLDWAVNSALNNGRRQLQLPGGRTLADFALAVR